MTPKDKKDNIITARVDAETAARLQNMATKEERPLSFIVRKAIERSLEK